MKDCIFCEIANGRTGTLVWSSEKLAAFQDIHPKAPVHILIVPKQHIADLDELSDRELAADLFEAVKTIAHRQGVMGAYKLQLNNGARAGQEVGHLHFHLLGYPAS